MRLLLLLSLVDLFLNRCLACVTLLCLGFRSFIIPLPFPSHLHVDLYGSHPSIASVVHFVGRLEEPAKQVDLWDFVVGI